MIIFKKKKSRNVSLRSSGDINAAAVCAGFVCLAVPVENNDVCQINGFYNNLSLPSLEFAVPHKVRKHKMLLLFSRAIFVSLFELTGY